MSRLDFVRGIKVSARRKVLGNYTKAAAGFRERGEFGIYVGDAMLIFELFRPRTRLARRDRRALEPLPAARRAPDRRGGRAGQRAAARVGARLAGLPRGRRASAWTQVRAVLEASAGARATAGGARSDRLPQAGAASATA